MVDKVIRDRDGKVAVLVSPGYGAGWSTWMTDEKDQESAAFDRRFVEACEEGVADIESIAIEVFGHDNEYLGGWRSVEIMWVPVGERFMIDEYDGAESLVREADIEMYTA